jgi:polyhydroxybutyrate depolymerase
VDEMLTRPLPAAYTGPAESGGMSRPALLALVGVLALLAGCRPAARGDSTPAIPSGSSNQTITVDGRERSFQVYRPTALPDRAPLVVMLHGGFGSASQAEAYYGWDAKAEVNHFVVAYPDGVNRAWAVGDGCCGTPGSAGVDDVAFVSAVVATLSRRLPIDADRVYATGISNGGLLAYRLACDTTLFAAIGPDSATLLGACPSPAPVSVLHIHGTADQNIPYDGSQGSGFAKIHGMAVPALVAMWQGVDGCPPPTVTIAGPVTTSIATCPGGRSVELITIANAGHQWPGSPSRPAAEKLLGLDPPSNALDATDVIWRFFADHHRR